MEETKKAIQGLNDTWAEFKKILERQDAEIKMFGAAKAETQEILSKLNTRLDDFEVKLNRASHQIASAVVAESKMYQEAFVKWARYGSVSADEQKFLRVPEEQKSLNATVGSAGGYLVTDEFVAEILKNVVEFSPIRSIARVRTTSQRSVKIPSRTGTFSAAWVAEQGTRSETTGLAYGLKEIPTHEVYALVDISKQELEDSAFNMEAELQAEFGEQFGVAEGTAFVSGNGIGKPEGFTVNSDISYTAGGHASQLNSGDALVSLFYALKGVYANNGSWVLNRTTLGVVRKLKDGTGAYIWQPNYQVGQPPAILGRPYVEATDMADIGANAFPIAFGDFRKGYIIVDRTDIEVQRDPYTQATSGNVRFIARKRLGGQLVIPEAVRLLKIATS